MADDAVVERFCAFLRGRKLPVTSQRLAIAHLMLHARDHLSAEDVTGRVQEQGHKAGLATVYRTIDLLVESKLLVERDFGEGFRRFEPARDVPQHEHMLCKVCGAVDEFHDERIIEITKAVAQSRGFSRDRHRLVIHGTCRNCQRAAGATDRRSS
ncbi:MAG: Fur family transcriptional regulator [Gemmatimonadaceae bacterium]